MKISIILDTEVSKDLEFMDLLDQALERARNK